MNKLIHFIGVDVHQESVAVSIAPFHSTEVRHLRRCSIGKKSRARGAADERTRRSYAFLGHWSL
jgi:hypothetical protein